MTPERKERIQKLLKIGVIAGAWALVPGCVSNMFYYPSRAWSATPDRLHLAYEEFTFASGDGTRLSGWIIPAKNQPAKGTVLHLHGNAQNMSQHFSYVAWLPRAGYNVVTFDYRGYGKSEGRVGRKGIYQDSLAAMKHVPTLPGVDPERIAVLGQSLGGANAIAVLGREKLPHVKALMVDSTFFSYRSIVRDKIGSIPLLGLLKTPLSWMVIGNQFSPGPVAEDLPPIPKLLIHGTADPVIPFSHGEALANRLSDPVTFLKKEGGEHTDALIEPEYQRQILQFLETSLGAHP